MAKHILCMDRLELGSDHIVFLHLDTICSQENLPLFDFVCLTPVGQSSITNGFIPGVKGLKLILPIPLAFFLSYQELQMLCYMQFMQFRKPNVGHLQDLVNRYSYEDSLSFIVKTGAILEIWDWFCVSEEFRENFENNQISILSDFYLMLSSRLMWEMAGKKMQSDRAVWNKMRELSKDSLSRFIDKAALVQTNKVFDLENSAFIQTIANLFIEISNHRKAA